MALLTYMDCPIGNAIGNALEVAETLQCLHGHGPDDLVDIVCDLGISLFSLEITGVFYDYVYKICFRRTIA